MSGILIRKGDYLTQIAAYLQPQCFERKLEKQKKLTYFVLCKQLYGVVGAGLELAQVEVRPGEGDHPGHVARPLDHRGHVLILVLRKHQVPFWLCQELKKS